MSFLKKNPGLFRGLLILLVGLVLGFASAYLTKESKSNNAFPVREQSGNYEFIKPLLACEVGDKKEFEEYSKLENNIGKLISKFRQEQKISSASFYFRDMDSGRWTGVNEGEKYSPASLHKVSLMMAYLKNAETNPAILNAKIVFQGSRSDEKPDYEPMSIGKAYTVRDLIYRLIVYSDNDAKDILHNYINQHSIDDVFSDLGLERPSLQDIGDTMSAKDYARFFRILYSATYLNRYASETALAILANTEFNEGIIKGLPPELNLRVSHKYGYRTFKESIGPDNITKELHDCGIIYYPNNPYFICVMTKGWNINDLKQVIQDVSKTVFTEIKS